MKTKLKKALTALLCAALVLALLPAPARALTLTAVNDAILPVSDSTMPARLGGELYVPYGVFTRLGVAASSSDGVLELSGNGVTLSFSPDEGYVYDQNLNSYSTPAYNRNGTVYVPVKLCCGVFGLGYSTLTVAGETVLRVTDGSAQSDAAFTASNADVIQSAINTYNGVSTPNNGNNGQTTKPEEPPVPPVEEKPAQKPARVYLTFYGAPSAHTADVLDALQSAGRKATFFLSADEAWMDDAVRRIAAEGHTLALLLKADEKTAPDELTASLAEANRRLAFLTGLTARLVTNETGCDKLTQTQRDAIAAAGYRLWDTTLDSGDGTQSSARAYATTAQHFASTNAVVVLRLHHTKATAQTVAELTAYMARQGIPASRITLATTPMNSASDTR